MDAVKERCQVAMWFNAQWLLMESSWHYGISKRNGIMQTKQKWKKKTDSPLTLQYEEALKNEKEQNLSDLKEWRQNSDLPFIPKRICFLIDKRTVFFLVRGTTLSSVWFKAAECFPSLQYKTLYQKSLILLQQESSGTALILTLEKRTIFCSTCLLHMLHITPNTSN